MPYVINKKTFRKVYIGHYQPTKQRADPGLNPHSTSYSYSPIQVRQAQNTNKIGPLEQDNKSSIVENELPKNQFVAKPEAETPPQPEEGKLDTTKSADKPIEPPALSVGSVGGVVGQSHLEFQPRPLTSSELSELEKNYKESSPKKRRKNKKHSFLIA